MNSARFYGKNKYANPILGDGHLSDDDELDSDSEVSSIPVPVRRPIIIPEIDGQANGRHELKQYNPAKPDKWGYKSQVLSGASGFSYDFDLFAGEQRYKIPEGAPDLGVSGNVVARLTETVPKHKNHKILFDNWYNSPKLQVYLAKNGLLTLGIARMNRVPNAEMPTEK